MSRVLAERASMELVRFSSGNLGHGFLPHALPRGLSISLVTCGRFQDEVVAGGVWQVVGAGHLSRWCPEVCHMLILVPALGSVPFCTFISKWIKLVMCVPRVHLRLWALPHP